MNKEAAIVIRFTADFEGTHVAEILKTVREALDTFNAKNYDAWMGIDESLDSLNESLTKLGWPPRTLLDKDLK